MAERLAEVQTRRASVEDLRSVVDAMRSLAAVRVQQATGMLAGVRGYAEIVTEALHRAAALRPEGTPSWPVGTGAHATILFAPEHGFVGALAERVLADAGTAGELWVVGSRGAVMLQEQGCPPTWSCAMATHSDEVIGTARRVADALYRRAAAAPLATVDLVYPVARHGVVRETLLPVARPQGRRAAAGSMPPLANVPPDRLIALLAEEYVFARLAHAAVEGYAAENTARLSVMVTARENIDGKLDELRSAERRLRQEDITLEVLELAGGSFAS